MAVDHEGLLTILDYNNIQPHYKPVLDDLVELLKESPDQFIKSILVYGTVARGSATAYESDLDITLLVEKPLNTNEKEWLKKIEREFLKTHPIISKIDFDVGLLSEIEDVSENGYRWRYWIKHCCCHLWGLDLADQIPKMHPSSEITIALNRNFKEKLEQQLEEINNSSDPILIQRLMKTAARKLLRSTTIIGVINSDEWPETLIGYLNRIQTYWPEKEDEFSWFYRRAEDGGSLFQRREFTSRTNELIQWLEESFDKEQKQKN